MPAKLDRCVERLKAKGHSESSAYAICKSATGLSQAVKVGRISISRKLSVHTKQVLNRLWK